MPIRFSLKMALLLVQQITRMAVLQVRQRVSKMLRVKKKSIEVNTTVYFTKVAFDVA